MPGGTCNPAYCGSVSWVAAGHQVSQILTHLPQIFLWYYSLAVGEVLVGTNELLHSAHVS